ncbi:Noc2p [Rhizoctonia solani 123E]|uniref:Noc2p n=1 Tax=Rhizoctonia solani 123E TaxID=1423351 RepID=A0A074S0U4_9AGAM|nr:Noc2p [Rhizoctonia solani 123E]
MGKKAAKATRKFAKSGELKRTIQARRKHKAVKAKVQARRGAKKVENEEDEDEDEEIEEPVIKSKTVDDLLNGDLMEEEGESDDEEDAESLGSMDDDDEQEEGQAHAMDLAQLQKNDPEFYKYLQDNDRELLDFNPDDMEFEDDEDMEESNEKPILTSEILKSWQRSLIETHSLRTLRKLLVAFKAAAYMNDEDVETRWRVDSAAVFNKLVTTTLKYTPIIAAHHAPYKTLPGDKFKPPTTNATLSKLLLSHLYNAIHLIEQLPSRPTQTDDTEDGDDDDTPKSKSKKSKKDDKKAKKMKKEEEEGSKTALVELALSETGKLVPWVVGSRKAVKMWLKTCLSLWSTSADSVRISAFLAVRRIGLSADEAVVELVMKNTYLSLLRSSKSTSPHTLPSLTLMKNSASELFRQQACGYTVAFGYIRQLAVHLRASTKVKTKEAYKQVYNWQFVHCVDFWSLVLARGEEELQPLVYPLVQVGLGAVSLIPSQRYHPLHIHILASLHHLATHTQTYIPISSHLLPILTSYLSTTSKPKSTMLKPLDMASTIRAPSTYLKTHVLAESVVQEAVWLLAESVPSNSVAFPELVSPIVSTLKKLLKKTSSASGKVIQGIKSLVEHLEEHSKWTAEQRKNVQFGPERWEDVKRWEHEEGQAGPLERWVRVLRKQREGRRKLVDGAVDA